MPDPIPSHPLAIRQRQPNGELRRPSRSARERAAIAVALAQPHRRAAKFPEHEWRCEAFGRLILDRGWGYDAAGRQLSPGPAELWNAGNRLKREYQAWQHAKASRRAFIREDRPTGAPGPEAEAVAAANRAIARFAATIALFERLPARCYEAAEVLLLADPPEDFAVPPAQAESLHQSLRALAGYFAGN
jgi:hypothetical protein